MSEKLIRLLFSALQQSLENQSILLLCARPTSGIDRQRVDWAQTNTGILLQKLADTDYSQATIESLAPTGAGEHFLSSARDNGYE